MEDVGTVPGGTVRTRLPRRERRALLLDAAMGAFSENGYHATAMDDIADRAGVSKPVLYQHFDSKLDLYLALAAQVRDGIVSTVEQALGSTGDNAARLRAAVMAFFTFVERPDSGYPLIMASDMGGEPAVAQILQEARVGCAQAVGRVLQEQTDLLWEDCVLLGMALVGQVQTAAMHWIDAGSRLDRQHAADLLLTVIWRGLGAMPQVEEGSAAEVVARHGDHSPTG